jgi:hypothetical protein
LIQSLWSFCWASIQSERRRSFATLSGKTFPVPALAQSQRPTGGSARTTLTPRDACLADAVHFMCSYCSFNSVMWGPDDRIIPGNALAVDEDMPFSSLTKFGTEFLNKFQASMCNASVLRESADLYTCPPVPRMAWHSHRQRCLLFLLCYGVAEKIFFVDTPGVLSGEKQKLGRAYEFVKVTEWFAQVGVFARRIAVDPCAHSSAALSLSSLSAR